MRKNKFIYSLLCFLTVCSFSLFAFTSRSTKKTQSVNADSYVNVYKLTGSNEINYNTYNNLPCTLYSDYNLTYNKVFTSNSNYYIFNLDFTFYFRYQKNSNNYYIYDNSYLAKFNTVWTSSRFLDIAPENSNIYFDITYIRGSIDNLSNYYIEFGADFNLNGDNLLDGAFVNRYLCHIYIDTGSAVTNSQFTSDIRYVGDSLRIFEDAFSPRISDYDLGYGQGYEVGYDEGYEAGSSAGASSGYQEGYSAGVESQATVIEQAYSDGYSDGYNEGFNADTTAVTIMSGIFQVALVPVNFFLGMMNFNILGINLATLIQSLFTVAMTIIVIRVVIGGKKGDK